MSVTAEEWRADEPPSWALPVTGVGDLILANDHGVLISVGAICAYPNGFVFYLTIALDPDRVVDRNVRFHRNAQGEQSSVARVRVVFSDGKIADSAVEMTEQAPSREPVLRFSGGNSVVGDFMPVPRSESRWWVSPLPPPGPVTFTVFLRGVGEPTGSGQIDANIIRSAAARSQVLWATAEPDPEC